MAVFAPDRLQPGVIQHERKALVFAVALLAAGTLDAEAAPLFDCAQVGKGLYAVACADSELVGLGKAV
jgi:hypothetical protein